MTHATDWCAAHGPRPCLCWDDGEDALLDDCWCGYSDGHRDECVCDIDDDACECPACDPPDLDELIALVSARPVVTPTLRPGLL